MARFDALLIEHGFAVGSTPFEDRYPGDEHNARIVLTVTPEDGPSTPMIVDTGAPWCILGPELAEAWGTTFHEIYRPSERLNIRGISYTGRLVRATIVLKATSGEDLALEATIFIPDVEPGETWNLPNFLGLDGLLNRIRFAVDPTENVFYFGPANT
jgi:hypothetical protein